MKKLLSIIAILCSLMLAQFEAGEHVPSDERGDPNYRRTTNEDVNKVRTSIFNYGITGRTGANVGEIPYEWPVNSGQHYIAMTALSVGAEVLMEDGTLKPLVTITFRQTQAGNTKAWEPVPGYLNPNSSKIAISDDITSWPQTWPDKTDDDGDPGWSGSWNGYFGKNQFSAEQEIYYKVSDDRNFRDGYTYIPDTTDVSRQGAGFLTGVRVMEWKQILIEDVVFILHDIKNDGTKDIEKASFSMWLADLVGGDGDSSDDTPDFDLINDVAWSMDNDGIGNSAFGPGETVGVAATSFIETPGNNADRIDNDGDGETDGEFISRELACGLDLLCSGDVDYPDPDPGEEDLTNSIDDNLNGIIDENLTHIPFGDQLGVSFADGIDNNNSSEEAGAPGCPVVTEAMIADAASDQVVFDAVAFHWYRWPPNPEADVLQDSIIHLIMVNDADLGKAFKDGIDNNADPDSPYALEYPFGTGAEVGSPLVTDEMVEAAEDDPYHRYVVPGTNIILYELDDDDVGKPYADGEDNDGDGAVDEGIDEGIDEMIDESRDDFIDNDGDWTSVDDVGLYGDGSGDMTTGTYDLKPTSGSGSGFQGEPNIDKTDVAESDQMGLTAVGYDPAGSIPTGSDNSLWTFYMTPGNFWQPPPGGQPPGDYDLFVTSGFFPLEAGQTERIAMAVCLGNNQNDALRNKEVAQTTYDFDYQFAKSPLPPNVTAVAADGKVTLYWDRIAEDSEDRYMSKITNGAVLYDFEGYKIYRATDFEFNDALQITDGDGNPTFFRPYTQGADKAQWDLVDGISGFHEVDLNGIKFYLGDDTGLQHTYVDTNVVNGQRYYYAVVSYDYGGDTSNKIIPSDSPMRLRVNSLTGVLELGPNVVEVVPTLASAGYVEADGGIPIQHVSGSSSGDVFYEIVDPMEVKPYHTYQITFTEMVKPNQQGLSGYDTLTTKYWYLEDLTAQDTLVAPYYEYFGVDTLIYIDGQPIEMTIIDSIYANPLPEDTDTDIIDGFKLRFNNVASIYFNSEDSRWSNESNWEFNVRRYNFDNFHFGTPLPSDYRIIWEDSFEYESFCFCSAPSVLGDPCLLGSIYCTAGPGKYFYAATNVNFHVQKKVSNTGDDFVDWQEIDYAFGDFVPIPANGGGDGLFNANTDGKWDAIVFFDHVDDDGDPAPSWFVNLKIPVPGDNIHINNTPQAGDTAYIFIDKPFLASDIYQFTTVPSHIDEDQAKNDMKNIYVVPNPYLGGVPWEGKNIFANGRGPREIQFRKLPAKCTIRIYTINGELVKKLDHDTTIDDGSESWDLLTKDNLAAAYGVYVFHVDAPGVGEHVGKFAIVK